MTIGDYRCLGATLGATPVVVEFLVKLALAASNGQGLVVKLTLDGDDVKALLCLFQATAEASRLRTDDEDEEDDEDEDDDEDDEEERGARELTLSELCKTVLPEEALNEIRGALSRAGDSMGIRDEKVENMGYDRKRQMTRIAAFLIRQVLNVVKAGQKDPGGVLREVLKDRSIKVLDDDERGREDILKCPIVRTIAASYRIAARTKDRRLRKQLLSLLAVQPDLRYEDIIDICSDECDLVVGVDVRVQVEGGKGQQYRLARITGVSLDEETQESVSVVEYYDVSSDFKKRRHATMGQATTAYTSELENPNAAPSGREEDVARRRIKVLGAVNCTRDQIWKARVHAAQHFPGAPVPKQFFSRTRLTGPRAEQLALSLTPGGGDVVFAEASDRNIFRGVQFMRVEKRKTLWRRLVKRMEAKGLRPIDWKTYFYASTQKSTIDSSALNCTCGQCRDLGYATFEELRAIVDDLREAAREAALELPSGLLTRLEKRVVCLERFMQHGYARLLQEQSSNARLCVRMALTTAHDHHFKQPCEHPRSDATVGEAPRSMSDEMRHVHNREPVDADWEVDCGSCAKLAGKVYLCDGCNVVCCMDCVKMKMNDVDTRDDVAEEVAEDDSVESNIGDSGGGGGGDDDNNARFSTGWRCPQCQLLHDAMRHSNDDPEVNELEWALEDIQRVVEALPTTQAEDTSEDGDSDDRTWLLTRLAEVCENLERLRAHKLRTWYFSRFKAHVLELVKNDPTLAFDLSDYWGKLPPRKAQEACGEGTQSGMSVHGSYFVIQNPPLALRNQHQDVDWSLWPPPPEEAAEGSAVQSDFVVLNFQVLCDDARQTPYSVRCVKELQYERIQKAMPWLLSVFGQSDQCDDYHSTQAVIAFSQLGRGESLKLRIVEHGHTEPGEGKNVVDQKCGQGKQDLARDRDAGFNHEDADEIFDGLERRRRVGDYYTVMEIDRSKEQHKKKPALPNIHDYEHSTYSDNGDIVCREAWGYGPGRCFSKEEVEKHDQHRLGDPGTGATAVKSSESLVPKSQFSNGQRHEARAEKRRKASGKADLAKKKKDADKAAIEEERGVDKSQTCKCGHTLLTPGAMQAHKNAGCGQSQRRRAAQQRSRPTVSQFMGRMVDEATVERELERRELALVTVELPRNLAGLSFERDVCSTIRVASVSGEAAASLVVAEGYALLTIDGSDVADGPSSSINAAVEAALGAADGEMATFVFERPSPPLPPHGWARKAMRRQANARFTTQQKAFLDRHFESSLKGGERMREKKVYKLMKTELGRKLGADGRSLVLTQAQIRGYFSRRAASMKRSAVDAVIGGDDGDNGNDEDVGDGDDEYESFKIPELKAMLREKSLDEKGKKAELIARLRADDEDLGEAEPAPKRQRR